MTLHIEGIPVEVQRKKIKNLHLYVKPPDGHVLVTAPLSMRDETIARFVQTKAGWLTRHVAKFAGRTQPASLLYQTGETLMVWSVPYRLEVRHGGRNSLLLLADTAILTVRENSTAAQREKVVRAWYRTLLTAEIEQRLPAWETVTGLKASSIQIKAMHTRWGTCNIQTGKLWFSLYLAQKPIECLDYIILHELLHLKERKHNAYFYRLLDQYMPSWQERRALLR